MKVRDLFAFILLTFMGYGMIQVSKPVEETVIVPDAKEDVANEI